MHGAVWAALLVLTAFAFAATPATGAVLVSSKDQTRGTDSNVYLAQSFATDSESATLTNIQVVRGRHVTTNTTLAIEIRSNDSSDSASRTSLFTALEMELAYGMAASRFGNGTLNDLIKPYLGMTCREDGSGARINLNLQW